MSYQLTEEKVLNKLGIEDFRHLTKEKAIEMASMLDKMDPEVAKKALEQFPEFSKTMKEMMVEYRETINRGIESNDKSLQAVHEAYGAIMSSLQEELKKEDLTFKEKKYIIEQMKEIADRVDKKDTENKKFIASMSKIAAGIIIVAGAGLAVALGGNTNISLTSKSNPKKIDNKKNTI